ncbi:MAG: dual specificity protein phosphatase family protein [Candidatus Promineifilaceae bacterium]|nr:dual specificity protein phosphatase family protein [Candidatus Promineifilaceae bacterium]
MSVSVNGTQGVHYWLMTVQDPPPPIPDSYRVDFSLLNIDFPPGARLWGGPYPGNQDPALAGQRLEQLLEIGVSHFINLTEAQERSDHYDLLLAQAAATRSTAVGYQRIPIADYSVPPVATIHRILDSIDTALVRGDGVYVHCWGGIGRTGTIIGCWLVRHGLSGRQALQQIAAWRKNLPSASIESPETDAQRQMVLNWQQFENRN